MFALAIAVIDVAVAAAAMAVVLVFVCAYMCVDSMCKSLQSARSSNYSLGFHLHANTSYLTDMEERFGSHMNKADFRSMLEQINGRSRI